MHFARVECSVCDAVSVYFSVEDHTCSATWDSLRHNEKCWLTLEQVPIEDTAPWFNSVPSARSDKLKTRKTHEAVDVKEQFAASVQLSVAHTRTRSLKLYVATRTAMSFYWNSCAESVSAWSCSCKPIPFRCQALFFSHVRHDAKKCCNNAEIGRKMMQKNCVERAAKSKTNNNRASERETCLHVFSFELRIEMHFCLLRCNRNNFAITVNECEAAKHVSVVHVCTDFLVNSVISCTNLSLSHFDIVHLDWSDATE